MPPRGRLTGPALVVAAAALAFAGDPPAAERLDALVEDLGELDASVRARAAKELRKLGPDAVPELMRRLPADVGSRRFDGVLDAVADLDVEAAIAAIQSTRSEWTAKGWRRSAKSPPPKDEKPAPRGRRAKEPEEAPEGERVVDAILTRLRARRAPSVRRSVALESGALWDAAFVPPWLAQPVGKRLPEALAGADVPVRDEATRLALDVARDGKFATFVSADAARVIETGPKRAPRRVVVFRRLGGWFAAPAATLAGEVDGTPVEFLDADQDGAFDGDADVVRFGDGAYRRLGADEHVAWTGAGIVTWRLRRDGPAWALDVETEPEPAWRTPEQAKELAALAAWRQAIGLAPQRIDRARSEACGLHHAYWTSNGFSGHDEYKDRPGFTDAGATAGKRSSVGTSPEGDRFVRDIGWTILHRGSCVGDAGDGVGAFAGPAGSLLWGTRIDASGRGFPILVPGAGQSGVPVKCEPEIPVPDRDPRYYETPRGAPVAVTWSRAGARWTELKDLRLELFADGEGDDVGDPLSGTLWCAEHRYKEDFAAGFPEESAIFCAAQPLAPGTSYTARFRATGREGPVEIVWQFRTE